MVQVGAVGRGRVGEEVHGMRSPEPQREANSPLKGYGGRHHFYVHRLWYLLKIKYFHNGQTLGLTSPRGQEIKCFNRYRIPLSDVTAKPNPEFTTYEHILEADDSQDP